MAQGAPIPKVKMQMRACKMPIPIIPRRPPVNLDSMIFPPKIKIKRCAQPKLRTPKNANSDCCYTKLNKHGDNSRPYIKLEFAFLPNSLLTFGHRSKTLYKNRESSRIGLLNKFCVAILLYHNFIHFSTYFDNTLKVSHSSRQAHRSYSE